MAETPIKTPEQLADEQRRDIMAYAYKDADGKFYTVNDAGALTETTVGAEITDGRQVKPLSPRFQQVANQTAALMMTYHKMLALNEVDRGLLSKLFKGQVTDTSGLSDAAKKFYEEAKKSVGGTIPGTDALGHVVNAGVAVHDIALSPTNILGDILGAGQDVIAQWGGGELDRAHALAIGTAYASAREAIADGRPATASIGDYFQGVFSRNIGAYLGAGFAWLLDAVTGLAEHLPGIGDWIKEQGFHKNLSLAEHIDRSMREADNTHVEQELGKVEKIGGVNSGDLSVLTRGGVINQANGKQTQVGAADKNNDAPVTANPQTPKTLDAAVEKQKAEPKKNPLVRSYEALRDYSYVGTRTTVAVAENHPFLFGGAVAAAATGVYHGQAGFVRGVAHQLVGDDNLLLRKANQLKANAAKLMEESKIAADGKPNRTITLRGVEREIPGSNTAPNLAKAEKLEKQAQTLLKESEKLAENVAERVAGRNSSIVAEAKPLVNGGKTMLELANEVRVPAEATGRIGKMFAAFENTTHAIGRGIGNVTGRVVNGFDNLGHRAASTIKNTFKAFSEGSGAPAATGETTVTKPSVVARTGKAIGTAVRWVGGKIGLGGTAAEGTEIAVAGTELATRSVFAEVTAFIQPVWSSASLVHGVVTHDKHEKIKAGAELGTIGATTLAGAGLGLCGGPFAPLTVPAGAFAGLVVGGVVSMFSGRMVANHYAPKTAEAPIAAAPVPVQQTEPGLHELAVAATLRQQAAQAQAQTATPGFRSGTVHVGATHPASGDNVVPTSINAQNAVPAIPQF